MRLGGDPFPLRGTPGGATVAGMKQTLAPALPRSLSILVTMSLIVLLAPFRASAQADDTPASVEFVLDSSGSMAGPDPSGGTKLDAAKRSMNTMLDGLPDNANVALRVYGARYADKRRGCTDTQLVLPLGPLDRASAKAAVGKFRPVGQTPIGYSLRQAATDLPTTGQRTIVLVSDGEETCGPQQPCDVARDLAARGINLHIDTVGFRVDNAARQQLTCIAQVTRGRYYDAPDAAALTRQLARASNSALRPYVPSGTPVTGTPTPAGAPTLRPGQYVDTLRAEEKKFYAVDFADGVTPYLAVTVIRPLGTVLDASTGRPKVFSEDLELHILGASGVDCGSTRRSATFGSWVGPTTGAASPGRVGRHWEGRFSGPYDSSCGLPGRYVLSASRTPDEDVPNEALPIEINFLAEPPLGTDVSVLPAPMPTSAATPIDPDVTAKPRKVYGGGSYGAAGKLGGSGTFTDTIRPGETLFYRVKLNWGQRLAYAVGYRATKDTLGTGVEIDTWLASPARIDVGRADDSTYYGPSIEDGEVLKGSTVAPVAYRNRESDDDAVHPLSLAGYYYLLVSMDNSDKPETPDVRLDISVRVQGQPQSGPSQGPVAGAADPQQAASGGKQISRSAGAREQSSTEVVKTAAIAGGGIALLLAGLAVALPLLMGGRRKS